jgi:hypothetical protein
MQNLANSFPDLRSIARARIEPDIFQFARSKFPDISDELIQQNLCELITAQDAEQKCGACCMGLDMCPELINTAGYIYVLAMQSSGRIKMEYAPCEFNGGRKNQAIAAIKVNNFKQLDLEGIV